MKQSGFHHEVFFYGDSDEYLAGTVPYLRGALENGEPALVAVGSARTEALRAELGSDAAGVRFVDMEAIGRNPARIIPFWCDFVEDHGGNENWPLRGIGEPAWPGRSADELDECRRHERLLNVAFDGTLPWSLLCPYDTRRLADEELEAAARCHPFASGAGPEPAAGENGSPLRIFAGNLSSRPERAALLEFDRSGLAEVRALVGREAGHAGLGRECGSDLVTAASELAANSVSHGGGSGTIWAWRDEGEMVVEVGDAGRIDEPLVGRHRPPPTADCGRGLWIANLLCDLVQIRSGQEGTVVRLRMRLADEAGLRL
jgi:anti-sigma regulatory factor (Ser/Thr protein kinase)